MAFGLKRVRGVYEDRRRNLRLPRPHGQVATEGTARPVRGMIMELKVLKPFTHFNDGIVHALTDDLNVVDFDDEDKFYDKSDFDSYIDKLNTEYTKKMLPLTRDNEPDYERAHSNADDLLCELLRKLGFDSVVNAFGEVGKWYA